MSDAIAQDRDTPQRGGTNTPHAGRGLFYRFPMGKWHGIARLGTAVLFAPVLLLSLAGCVQLGNPSVVSREAAGSEVPPLAIRSELVDPDTREPIPLTLSIEDTENKDWFGYFRPDSRENGFEGLVLDQNSPEQARVFQRADSFQRASFTLIGRAEIDGRDQNVVQLELAHDPNQGWLLMAPGAPNDGWTGVHTWELPSLGSMEVRGQISGSTYELIIGN